MKIKYSIYRPSGNDTALVEGLIEDGWSKKHINDLIQKKHSNVEQVGFVEKKDGKYFLEMAGGEFCGNATRSAIHYFLKGIDGEIPINVSGVSRSLRGGIALGEAWVEMPIDKNVGKIRKIYGNDVVEMEGISHVVTDLSTNDQKLDLKEKALKILKYLQLDESVPAAGVMFVSSIGGKFKIEPIVWVRDLKTLYYETACGSGTTAVGLFQSKKQNKSLSLSVIQPSKLLIKIKVVKNSNVFESAVISGEVVLLEKNLELSVLLQATTFFNLPILSAPRQTVFDFFSDLLDKKMDVHMASKNAVTTIFTPNPEQIVMAKHDQFFQQTLSKADFLLPDGIGLVIASKILKFFGRTKHKIQQRIPGVDLVEHLLAQAQAKGLTTLIIGGRDYAGETYQGELFEDEQSLKKLNEILYWTEAYQEKTDILAIEEETLVKIIKKLHPAIIFVALGAPDQEEWIEAHRALLDQNKVKIAMAVGGSFDFLFAKVARAPFLMQKIGLEWFWRLMKQPWRRRRQLRLIEFIYLIFRELFH